MDDLDIIVFLACLVLVGVGAIKHHLGRHADGSVTGIWVVFYVAMGYVAVKFCGQAAEPEDTDRGGAGTPRGPGL